MNGEPQNISKPQNRRMQKYRVGIAYLYFCIPRFKCSNVLRFAVSSLWFCCH